MKMKTARSRSSHKSHNGNGHSRNGNGNGHSRNGHSKKLDAIRINRRAGQDVHVKTAERVSAELSGMHNGMSAELVQLLEASEECSRKIVAVELDLRREHEIHARLESDNERLDGEVEEARASNAELAKKKQELEDEAEHLRKVIDTTSRDVDKLTGDVEGMTKELKELQAENAGLEARKAKLGEDIVRLKKLRAEYLANIGKLKGDKDDLTA